MTSPLNESICNLLEDASRTGDSYQLFEWFLIHHSYLEHLDSIYLKISQDILMLTEALPENELKLSNILKIFLDFIQAYGINEKTCIKVAKPLLYLAVDEKCSFMNLKRAVTVFNLLLINPVAINAIMSDESLEGSLQILGRKVPTVGDYEVQAVMFEAMFRLTSTNRDYWAHIWFVDSTLKNLFLNIDPKQFEPNCRKALNYMNRHELDRKVFSFIANSVTFGYIQLKEPGDCDFWIDFNYDSESISFFCSEISETGHSSDSSGLWETIVIHSESVESYTINCKTADKSKELVLQLKYPCQTLIASSNITNPALESYTVCISFWGILDLIQHLENIYGKGKHLVNTQIGKRERVSDSVSTIQVQGGALEDRNSVSKRRKISDARDTIEVLKRNSEICSSEILSEVKPSNACDSLPLEADITEVTRDSQSQKRVSNLVYPILVPNKDTEKLINTSSQKKASELSYPIAIPKNDSEDCIPSTYENPKPRKVSGTSEIIKISHTEVPLFNPKDQVKKCSMSADAVLCDNKTINHEICTDSYKKIDISPSCSTKKISVSSEILKLDENESGLKYLEKKETKFKSYLKYKSKNRPKESSCWEEKGDELGFSKFEPVSTQSKTDFVIKKPTHIKERFRKSLKHSSKAQTENANIQNSGKDMISPSFKKANTPTSETLEMELHKNINIKVGRKNPHALNEAESDSNEKSINLSTSNKKKQKKKFMQAKSSRFQPDSENSWTQNSAKIERNGSTDSQPKLDSDVVLNDPLHGICESDDLENQTSYACNKPGLLKNVENSLSRASAGVGIDNSGDLFDNGSSVMNKLSVFSRVNTKEAVLDLETSKNEKLKLDAKNITLYDNQACMPDDLATDLLTLQQNPGTEGDSDGKEIFQKKKSSKKSRKRKISQNKVSNPTDAESACKTPSKQLRCSKDNLLPLTNIKQYEHCAQKNKDVAKKHLAEKNSKKIDYSENKPNFSSVQAKHSTNKDSAFAISNCLISKSNETSKNQACLSPVKSKESHLNNSQVDKIDFNYPVFTSNKPDDLLGAQHKTLEVKEAEDILVIGEEIAENVSNKPGDDCKNIYKSGMSGSPSSVESRQSAQASSYDLFPTIQKKSPIAVKGRPRSQRKRSAQYYLPQSQHPNDRPSQKYLTAVHHKRSLSYPNTFCADKNEVGAKNLTRRKSMRLSRKMALNKEVLKADVEQNTESHQTITDFDSSRAQSRKIRLYNLDKAPIYDGPLLKDSSKLSPEHFVKSRKEKEQDDVSVTKEVIPDTLDEKPENDFQENMDVDDLNVSDSVHKTIDHSNSLSLYEIFPDSDEDFQQNNSRNQKNKDSKGVEPTKVPPYDKDNVISQSNLEQNDSASDQVQVTPVVEPSKKRRKAAVQTIEKNKKLFDAISEVEFDKGDTDTSSLHRSKSPVAQMKRKRKRSVTDTETGSSDVSWMQKKKCPLFETPKKNYSEWKSCMKKKLPVQVLPAKKNEEIKGRSRKKQPYKTTAKLQSISQKPKKNIWSDIEKHDLTIETSAKRGSGKIMRALGQDLSTSSCSLRKSSGSRPNSPNKLSGNEDFENISNFNEPVEFDDYHSPLNDNGFTECNAELNKNVDSVLSLENNIFSEDSKSKRQTNQKDFSYTQSFESTSRKIQQRSKDAIPMDSGLGMSGMNKEQTEQSSEMNQREQPELDVEDSGVQDVTHFKEKEDEIDVKQVIIEHFLESVTDYYESTHGSTSLYNYSGSSHSKKTSTCPTSKKARVPKPLKRKSDVLGKDLNKSRKKNAVDPCEDNDARNSRQFEQNLSEPDISLKPKSVNQQRKKKESNKPYKPVTKRKSKSYKSCLTPNKVDDLCQRLNTSTLNLKSPQNLQSNEAFRDVTQKLKDDSSRSFSPLLKDRFRKRSEDRSFGTYDSLFSDITIDSSFNEKIMEKTWFEKITSDLSKETSYLTRKLLATVQKCVRDYSFKMQSLRKNIAASVKILESPGKTNKPSKMVNALNKCKALRREVEKSLRKMRHIGQEFVDAEIMYCRKIKNKHIKACRKYMSGMKHTEKKAISKLEQSVHSQMKFFLKLFWKKIDLA